MSPRGAPIEPHRLGGFGCHEDLLEFPASTQVLSLLPMGIRLRLRRSDKPSLLLTATHCILRSLVLGNIVTGFGQKSDADWGQRSANHYADRATPGVKVSYLIAKIWLFQPLSGDFGRFARVLAVGQRFGAIGTGLEDRREAWLLRGSRNAWDKGNVHKRQHTCLNGDQRYRTDHEERGPDTQELSLCAVVDDP